MTQNRKNSGKLFPALIFSWVFAALCAQSATLNEWNFYSDPAGRTLSQATNSAGNISFSAGNEASLSTDGIGVLNCTNSDDGTSGMWTNGAILNAQLAAPVTSGEQFLRYDFSYDLSDPSRLNDSGTLLFFSFYDGTGDEVAGIAFQYDVGANATATYELVALTNTTDAVGTVAVIAKINLSNQTLSVWYDLAGDVSGFSETSPSANVAVLLSSFDSLRFQATGDIQPVGSSDHVAVDLLRTADSWEDILVADPAATPSLQIQATVSPSESMESGETNEVSVVIRNVGGVATNVTSALSHDKVPSAFTVTSDNTAQTLWPDELMTNTYTVVANTNGGFVFTAQAFIAGTGDISTTLNVVVGSQISYLTNSIAVVSTNGLFADDYEPGEIIDITVISTNDGAKVVSNIVNSLSVDSDYFSISNRTSTLYSSMAAGDTTSTVYRVTLDPATPHGTYSFNVTNAAGAKVWPGAFPIHVLNQGIPSVSPGALVFSVVEGDTELQTVTVSNAGNATLSFTINDNAAWENLVTTDVGAAPSEMEPGGTVIDLVDPEPSNQWVSAETDGESDTLDIGFSFPLQGTDYTKFYIDSNGAIFLSTTNRSADYASSMGSATLPIGSSPMIAPLRDKQMMIPAGSVRYLVKSNPQRLVIVHDGLSNNSLESTDLQFQTELFADGQIKFSYFNINGQYVHFAAVGFQADENNFVNIETVPASGTAVLIYTAEDPWVRYDPPGGSVPPLGSVVVTFTADATSQAVGTANAFTTTFNWGGGSDDVTVNASVVAAVPKLETVAAVLFEGPAGEITTMILDLTNSGKAALNFTITDTGSASASYQGAVSNGVVWTNVSVAALEMLNPDPNPYINAENEGFSALQSIGFEFPFYGGVYTHFSAGVNGGISLGTTNRMWAVGDFSAEGDHVPQQFIAPYWGNLFMDTNASIRFQSSADQLIVTWENMEQSGVTPGTDLTFQAVLHSSGRIEFRYQQVNGSFWPLTPWGIRSGPARSHSGKLILPGDEIIIVDEYGYPTTNYVNAISDRFISMTSSNYPIITYIPSVGTIDPNGGTAAVELRGNASGMMPGDANSVTNEATLDIVYEVGTNNVDDVTFMVTNNVDVTFVVTNSLEAVPVSPLAAALADADGDGMGYDAELIAGTDPLSADSVFTVSTDAGRVISWVYAEGRTYTVWYSLDLKDDFVPLAGAVGLAAGTHTDTEHAGVPVIFYKVSVD